MNFRGFIDSFENGVLAGWAFSPQGRATIDCCLNGEICVSVTPDRQRPDVAKAHGPSASNSGFRVDLSEALLKDSLATLKVFFGGTTKRIPFSNRAGRLFHLDLDEIVILNPSPWITTPPAPIIGHISGNYNPATQRLAYLRSGAIVAADALNIAATFGCNVQRPDFKIVDVGCGNGRCPSFLVQYVPACKYLGCDVHEPSISWARQNISSRFSNLQFRLLGTGTNYSGGQWHTLPEEAADADFVISTSLFTHLNRAATAGYLGEIYRVLRPGGIGYVTFFVLEEEVEAFVESKAAQAALPLIKDGALWSFGKDGYLDSYFRIEEIKSLVAASGLRLRHVRQGNWGGRTSENVAAFQDLIVLQKP
jgi:SAM-dependent methyltransferase